MRGKGTSCKFIRHPAGITPAHAGKRLGCAVIYCHHQDHPRTCGEKFDVRLTVSLNIGSPPHMRGKGENFLAVIIDPRITPAHAGKSSAFLSADLALAGSPPHMRGKVLNVIANNKREGITPAHAGKRWEQSELLTADTVQQYNTGLAEIMLKNSHLNYLTGLDRIFQSNHL